MSHTKCALCLANKEQILLPADKSKYQNVVELMTRENKLYYEIPETTFNSDSNISIMDGLVEQITKKQL